MFGAQRLGRAFSADPGGLEDRIALGFGNQADGDRARSSDQSAGCSQQEEEE
jgi:hypothetical protein